MALPQSSQLNLIGAFPLASSSPGTVTVSPQALQRTRLPTYSSRAVRLWPHSQEKRIAMASSRRKRAQGSRHKGLYTLQGYHGGPQAFSYFAFTVPVVPSVKEDRTILPGT